MTMPIPVHQVRELEKLEKVALYSMVMEKSKFTDE
jgi:hypothetical protein